VAPSVERLKPTGKAPGYPTPNLLRHSADSFSQEHLAMPHWAWVSLGAIAIVVAMEELRMYWLRRESAKKEDIFQVVTENAADMIALVDVKGRRLHNSPSYKRVLGYSPAELSETSSFEQIHPEDRMRVLEAARETRESGIGKRLEYRIKHKDGIWRVLESIASTIRDGKGEVAKLVIVNRDITERKRAEERLEYNLFHDPMTGLPNRRLFIDRLQGAFIRVRREFGPVLRSSACECRSLQGLQ